MNKQRVLPLGTTYQQAKQIASEMFLATPQINSIRLKVRRDSHEIIIEYTEYPQATVDKLMTM